MKKSIVSALILAAVLLPATLFSAITSVTGVTMIPPSPSLGQNVQLSFNYTESNSGNGTNFFIVISDTPTIQNAGSVGHQWLVYGDGCVEPGAPETAVCQNCCGLGSVPAGTNAAGPYNFTIPADLSPGVTYYVIVAISDGYYLALQTWGIGGGPTNGMTSFVPPLPPGSATITKTVESSTARPGDIVLYTIDYNVVNSDNFTITDFVPANCTLIKQSTGGTNTGTTPGSTLSWPIGAVSAPITGNVSFIVQIDSAALPATVNNTSSWTATDHDTSAPISGNSNTAALNIIAPITLVKSQTTPVPGPAAINDTITYTLDFHSGGETFDSFSTFDNASDITNDFTVTGSGSFSWSNNAICPDGCIFSNTQPGYPHLTKNTLPDFCYGEITGDIWIGNTSDEDGLIVFRDNRQTGVLNRAYGMGITADGNPGNLYLQELNPPEVAPPGRYLQLANPPFTPTIQASTWYTVRILVTDASGGPNPAGSVRIQARAWLKGTLEPATWPIDYTDTDGTPPCGYVGFQGHPNNTNYYDNLKIIRSNPSDVVVYDTLPAGNVPSIITYVGGTPADLTHGDPVFDGSKVSWSIFTSFTDTAYELQWWGTVNNCGDADNTASFSPVDGATIYSNTTSFNVPVCPASPTFTPTFTDTPTPPPSPTFTSTVTNTYTYTYTVTVTPTFTTTPTPKLPLMVLTKQIEPPAPAVVNPGDTITYNIIYTNNGSADATGFTITDQLDNYLSFVSCPGGGCTPPVATPGGTVSWVVGNVTMGTSGSVTLTASVDVAIPKNHPIANTAHSTTNETGGFDFPSNPVIVNVNVNALKLTKITTYPNPAPDKAIILFNITAYAKVTVRFYSISGELVRSMTADEVKANLADMSGVAGSAADIRPGENRIVWDTNNRSKQKVSSGIYFYRVDATSPASEKAFYIDKLAVMR